MLALPPTSIYMLVSCVVSLNETKITEPQQAYFVAFFNLRVVVNYGAAQQNILNLLYFNNIHKYRSMR